MTDVVASFRLCTPRGVDHFFGYYDRCPWDASGRRMLALEVPAGVGMPGETDAAGIVLVDPEADAQPRRVGETTAWCWQQGCMLQWLPGGGDTFIANDRGKDGLVSVVRDTCGVVRRVLPSPVYNLNTDASVALTLNFARLGRRRPGYGYAGRDETEGDSCPSNDGIFLMDMTTGRRKLAMSLEAIAAIKPKGFFAGREHWVNHLMFNPSGTRFLFVHRCGLRGGAGAMRVKAARSRPKSRAMVWARRLAGACYRRIVGCGFAGFYTRLFSCDLGGSDPRLHEQIDDASHYSWRDDRHFVVWGTRIGQGQGYWMVDDDTGESKPVGKGQLTEDGHCSWSPSGRWMLTDTYPNPRKPGRVLLFDTERDAVFTIGTLSTAAEWSGERRCDFHPRFDRSARRVCIDSTHEGFRGVYVSDVSAVTGGGL